MNAMLQPPPAVAPPCDDASLRVGLVGPGGIGWVHAAGIQQSGHRLAGVLAATPQTTAAAASALHTYAYGSIAALLRDVDVVHIATPDGFHFEQARHAIRTCDAVIVETPIAITPELAGRMLSAAERNSIVHATVLQHRYWRGTEMMRAAMLRHTAGVLTGARCRYRLRTRTGPGEPDWRLEHGHGGPFGLLAVSTARALDLVEYVTGGRIERVAARRSTGADPDHARTGETDLLTSSFTVQPGRGPRVKGAVTISELAGDRDELEIYCDTERYQFAWTESHPLEFTHLELGNPRPELPRLASATPADPAVPFARLFAQVYAATREQRPPSRPPYPTFRDGERLTRIVDALRTSFVGDGTDVWLRDNR